MSVQKPSNREVHCELTVLVTRNAAGDLVDGVRERLRRVDAVVVVEDVDVRGLTPGLNDLRVETAVRLRVREPPDSDLTTHKGESTGGQRTNDEPAGDEPVDGVRAALESGFGVRAVRNLTVEPRADLDGR